MRTINRVVLLVIGISFAQLIPTSANNNVEPEIVEDAEGIIYEKPDINNMNIPGVNAPLPTQEELLKMLDSMDGLSDEEKESLRDDLLRNIQYEQSGEKNPSIFNNNNNNIYTQGPLLFGLLGLITLIFGFIINKLYKSVILKERKLEEKRRLKKLKKNK